MKKYLAFFKISLKKSLEYRTQLLVWFFWDVAPALAAMFFWSAVYQIKDQIAGYNYSSMMIYLLIIMFARNLVLSHPDFTLQQEIYKGDINSYFLQPASLFFMKFFHAFAYRYIKLVYLIPFFFCLYFFFLKNRAISFNFETINIIFFLISCSFSFCLFFSLRFFIGMLSFWFTEIEWLVSFEELIFWFFGGVLLPLEIFPSIMQKIASLLPFKYVLFLPAQILLGKLSFNQIIISNIIQIFWIIIFYLLAIKTYKKGVKIYSAFGG